MEVGRYGTSGDCSVGVEEYRDDASFRAEGGSLFLCVARGGVVVHFFEVVEDLDGISFASDQNKISFSHNELCQ